MSSGRCVLVPIKTACTRGEVTSRKRPPDRLSPEFDQCPVPVFGQPHWREISMRLVAEEGRLRAGRVHIGRKNSRRVKQCVMITLSKRTGHLV